MCSYAKSCPSQYFALSCSVPHLSVHLCLCLFLSPYYLSLFSSHHLLFPCCYCQFHLTRPPLLPLLPLLPLPLPLPLPPPLPLPLPPCSPPPHTTLSIPASCDSLPLYFHYDNCFPSSSFQLQHAAVKNLSNPHNVNTAFGWTS